MTTLQLYFAAISAAIALSAGVVAPELLAMADEAQATLTATDARNRQSLIEAAAIFFETSRGRPPTGTQELIDAGYLKPEILEP